LQNRKVRQIIDLCEKDQRRNRTIATIQINKQAMVNRMAPGTPPVDHSNINNHTFHQLKGCIDSLHIGIQQAISARV
jgi:hypothetical protein